MDRHEHAGRTPAHARDAAIFSVVKTAQANPNSKGMLNRVGRPTRLRS
ncbi:MAG: hypothetical protein ACREM1_09755 [Longimicrobiales bacterium]